MFSTIRLAWLAIRSLPLSQRRISSALVLAATIGLTLFDRTDALTIGSDTVEVSMGGDVYSVVE